MEGYYKYFDWYGATVNYLLTSHDLCDKLIDDEERWRTYYVAPMIYLFRHGLELALKTYSINFEIPLKNNHDIERIGKKISTILSTLDTDNLEDSDDIFEIKLNIKGKEKIFPLRQGRIYKTALLSWEEKLPKIIKKYQRHNYTGKIFKDRKNQLARYPDRPEFLQHLRELKKEQLVEIREDIFDQIMLFQLVFYIKINQPLINE
jgi:hypothetical protein